MIGSQAAGDAADAQTASAAQATAEQRRQYDLNRADQAPFMASGRAGNQRLAYLLGLTPGGTSGTVDRAQFTTPGTPGSGGTAGYWADYGAGPEGGQQRWIEGTTGTPGTSGGFDQAGYDAALAGQTSNQSDPAFGSLMRRFSTSDLNADPVYNSGLKFGLDQGTGAINARAMQAGNYDSGATLKALTRYANDYGSTKANESYNRYNTDQTNQFNRLSGISGTGQTATNQVGAQGANTANQISSLLTDAGSARSAGIVGGANAWAGAAGDINQQMNNRSLQDLLKGAIGRSGSPLSSNYNFNPYGINSYES